MKKILKMKSLFRVVALTLVLLFSLQSSGCLVEALLGTAAAVVAASANREGSSYAAKEAQKPTAKPETAKPDATEAAQSVPAAETPAVPEKPSATEKPSETAQKPEQSVAFKEPPARTDITFEDIEYIEPDLDQLESDLAALLADIQASDGSDIEALLDRFDALMAVYNDADSVSSYAYIRYSQNVNDEQWQKRSDDISLRLTELDLAMTDCAMALMELGPQAKERWGEDFCNTVIIGDKLNDESVQELFKKEEDLINRYEVLIASYKVKYKGKEYSEDDLNTVYDEKGYDAYYEIFTAYMAGLNEQAGEIFLDLLEIRNEIANRLGYDSYATYQYASYMRDFTVEDAQQLHKYVKKYISSVFYLSLLLPYYVDLYDSSDEPIPFDSFLPKFREAIAEVSPKLTEALDYFLTQKTYDMTPDDNKMESSYSTYMSAYKMPFIFMQWEDDQRSAQTLTHEFGHYSNFYFNPAAGWSVTDPLDLCEIDSQGLEMLLMNDFESFYGRGAESARVDQIKSALFSLVSGCMEDEFQQYAYAHPDATLDELNDFYYFLCKDYGFDELYGYTGKEWVQIPHTFSSPLYYISYAVSVIPTLEIWSLSNTDRDEAVTAYLKIMNRDAYPEFCETVIDAGLSNPFAESTIKNLANSAADYLYSIKGN